MISEKDEYVVNLTSTLRERNRLMLNCAGLSRTKYIERYGEYLGNELWTHDFGSLILIEHELIAKIGSHKTDIAKKEIAQELENVSQKT
jgi:hypothetical protein